MEFDESAPGATDTFMHVPDPTAVDPESGAQQFLCVPPTNYALVIHLRHAHTPILYIPLVLQGQPPLQTTQVARSVPNFTRGHSQCCHAFDDISRFRFAVCEASPVGMDLNTW